MENQLPEGVTKAGLKTSMIKTRPRFVDLCTSAPGDYVLPHVSEDTGTFIVRVWVTVDYIDAVLQSNLVRNEGFTVEDQKHEDHKVDAEL